MVPGASEGNLASTDGGVWPLASVPGDEPGRHALLTLDPFRAERGASEVRVAKQQGNVPQPSSEEDAPLLEGLCVTELQSCVLSPHILGNLAVAVPRTVGARSFLPVSSVYSRSRGEPGWQNSVGTRSIKQGRSSVDKKTESVHSMS